VNEHINAGDTLKYTDQGKVLQVRDDGSITVRTNISSVVVSPSAVVSIVKKADKSADDKLGTVRTFVLTNEDKEYYVKTDSNQWVSPGKGGCTYTDSDVAYTVRMGTLSDLDAVSQTAVTSWTNSDDIPSDVTVVRDRDGDRWSRFGGRWACWADDGTDTWDSLKDNLWDEIPSKWSPFTAQRD
jgi:hypothetical protein